VASPPLFLPPIYVFCPSRDFLAAATDSVEVEPALGSVVLVTLDADLEDLLAAPAALAASKLSKTLPDSLSFSALVAAIPFVPLIDPDATAPLPLLVVESLNSLRVFIPPVFDHSS
jgi:hypothetical protein